MARRQNFSLSYYSFCRPWNKMIYTSLLEFISLRIPWEAPIQRVVDQVSHYFVPTVIILAVAAATIWFMFGPQPAFIYALIVFVTTLIIACPCALGLATPTSLTVGI